MEGEYGYRPRPGEQYRGPGMRVGPGARTRDAATAEFLLDYADFLESHIERWTVTTRASWVPGIKPTTSASPRRPRAGRANDDPIKDGSDSNRPPGAPNLFRRPRSRRGFLEWLRYGIAAPATH